MIIECRPLFDDGVHIGDGDADLHGSCRHGFSNGKLIQIERIIIVDGAPEKVSEIARRCFSLCYRPADPVQLGKCLGREIREQSSFQHYPMSNSLQDGTVLYVVGIRHHVT